MAMESQHMTPGGKQTMLWRPATLEEAWQIKRQFGDAALYVAGGTWLRTRWEGGLLPGIPDHVISLEHSASLRSMNLQQDGTLTVGSAVRVAEVLCSGLMRGAFPLLRMAAAKIASPSIRNLATVGGNVMTGNGDLLPALLASDAVLLVYDGRRMERIPAAEWLELPDRPAELLLAGIQLPQLKGDAVPFFHKIGRREQFTPSVLTVSGWYALGHDGRITDVRLSAGGAAMGPLRLRKAESAALGLTPDHAAPEVYRAVEEELPDYADDYASASYRKRTAANLIAAELMQDLRNGGGTDAVEP